MTISVPRDEAGRMARECPDSDCSPGYFKVKPGTGITENHTAAFCPYCRHSAEPNDFSTREQVRYAKDLVMREAHKGIQAVFKDALGLGANGKRSFGGGLISMEMSYKPGALPHVRRPFEDLIRNEAQPSTATVRKAPAGPSVWRT